MNYSRFLLICLGGAIGSGARLPILDEMLGDGLVTMEKVRVLRYSACT